MDFIVSLSIVSHCVSNHCFLSNSTLIRASMGDIFIPSDYGNKALYPIIFIQCVNGRDPMAHEFWSHGLDGLSNDVHLT